MVVDSEREGWEIPRDDFTVGFVQEASEVYEQILETERQAAVTGS